MCVLRGQVCPHPPNPAGFEAGHAAWYIHAPIPRYIHSPIQHIFKIFGWRWHILPALSVFRDGPIPSDCGSIECMSSVQWLTSSDHQFPSFTSTNLIPFARGIFLSQRNKSLNRGLTISHCNWTSKHKCFLVFPFSLFYRSLPFFQMWLVHIVDKRKKASKDVEVNARQKDKFSSDIRDLALHRCFIFCIAHPHSMRAQT